MTNPVKLLKDAETRVGSIPEVHRRLIKMGVEISVTALYNAASGESKSLKPNVIVALVHVAYDGDWKRGGKALETDYLPSGLK